MEIVLTTNLTADADQKPIDANTVRRVYKGRDEAHMTFSSERMPALPKH